MAGVDSARREAVLAQWEEGKRLNAKIESLRCLVVISMKICQGMRVIGVAVVCSTAGQSDACVDRLQLNGQAKSAVP